MKRFFVVLVALLPLSQTAARAAEYSQVRPAQGRVSFVSKQMGVPVDGEFKRFTARIAFDPAKPETARAALDIDLASIDVGSQEAYDEVVGKNWFNVRQFPQARFEASAVRALGGNRYEVRGPMTVRGRSREVAAPFTFTTVGKDAVFDGAFVLKRLEFGIGEGPWGDPGTVADEVQVKFRFVAGEAAPAPPATAKPAGKPVRKP